MKTKKFEKLKASLVLPFEFHVERVKDMLRGQYGITPEIRGYSVYLKRFLFERFQHKN